MHAKRLAHPRVHGRQPAESRRPLLVDKAASQATLSAERLTVMEPARGRAIRPEPAPALGDVDPWITVYVGIVKSILERERQGRGERSPAA